ncbi:hypothetical protein GCM10023205_11560 [Yinghuangia aomiensis]|uniref:Uncharacterized protein n=1 Tax=Yinghuangia aomiensis TaxID=676205 RepID=A0ABP9GT69_9ACTN
MCSARPVPGGFGSLLRMEFGLILALRGTRRIIVRALRFVVARTAMSDAFDVPRAWMGANG